MKNRYKCEMDRLEPRPEKLEELYELVEGGSEMKRAKRLSGRAAARELGVAHGTFQRWCKEKPTDQ